jgi:RimJ/RimL family protein N-acetyltransferase
VVLETARLRLRRFSLDDVPLLVELDSDPEVMRWLNGGKPTPEDVIRDVVLPNMLDYDDVRFPGQGFFAAVEKSSGDFIGWFGFRRSSDDAPSVVDLGYRLRRAAWGRGYATEGARALIEHGFASCGITRVTARTYEKNIGSRRVMEKAGMTFVKAYRPTPDELSRSRTAQHASEDVWDGDDVIYAIDRP